MTSSVVYSSGKLTERTSSGDPSGGTSGSSRNKNFKPEAANHRQELVSKIFLLHLLIIFGILKFLYIYLIYFHSI